MPSFGVFNAATTDVGAAGNGGVSLPRSWRPVHEPIVLPPPPLGTVVVEVVVVLVVVVVVEDVVVVAPWRT